jgi:hypothetical protein
LAVAEMLVIAILNLWLFIFAVPAYYRPERPKREGEANALISVRRTFETDKQDESG